MSIQLHMISLILLAQQWITKISLMITLDETCEIHSDLKSRTHTLSVFISAQSQHVKRKPGER